MSFGEQPHAEFLASVLDLLNGLLRVFEESHAQSIPVAIFMDLDHFKQINDRRVCDFGDEAPRVAATSLRSSLRTLDVSARWGGEQFIVVAPDLDGEQLQSFAERLQALMERCQIGRSAGPGYPSHRVDGMHGGSRQRSLHRSHDS